MKELTKGEIDELVFLLRQEMNQEEESNNYLKENIVTEYDEKMYNTLVRKHNKNLEWYRSIANKLGRSL